MNNLFRKFHNIPAVVLGRPRPCVHIRYSMTFPQVHASRHGRLETEPGAFHRSSVPGYLLDSHFPVVNMLTVLSHY